MAETTLQSCLIDTTGKIQGELDCFRQEVNSLLALLPGDNREVAAKSSTVMNMLQRHTDEVTRISGCLMRQHNELGRREQLLAAVNFMAAKLIGGADWRQHIHVILARLGKAAGVDRVYIFQDCHDGVGNLCTSQIEVWVAEDVANKKNYFHLGRSYPYKEYGFARWVHMLKSGRPVFGDIDTFPKCEQVILKKQKICSLLVMPIRHQDRSWGFIGFDNCQRRKKWGDVELDVLRTAANMLGGAISQQRVKEDLQEKERTYGLIMDAIKDGCWIVDDELRTIEVNGVLSEMLQRDKEEIERAYLTDFIHPECRQEVGRVLSGKALPGEEIDIILTSGNHILPATLHVSRLEGGCQERSKTFVFVRDQTTFQKMAEMNTALVESNNRLHGITNLARDAIILLDVSGNISFWNPAAARIFGYGADEVMGKKLRPLFSSDEQYQDLNSRFYHFLSSSIIQDCSSHVYEFNARRKDGTSLHVEISFAASIQENEYFILGVCRDISERYRAQLALGKSEKRYMSLANKFSAVLDAIPDGFIELMPDGIVSWANKGARSMFGLEEETIQKGCCCPCFSAKQKESHKCLATTTFKTGEKQQLQIVMEDGRIFDKRSFPIYGPTGNIDSVVLAVRDISRQLQLEAAASRSAHLASLGVMAAGVAHEINNPNNFIMLNAPLIAAACHDSLPLLDTIYREQGEFYLGGLPYSEFREKGELLHRGILDGSRRIAAIVSHLKEFACQDQRRAPVPMQINELVNRSVQLVNNQIRRYTSGLQLDLAKQLPSVSGSPGQIEQVIINLLLNAAESLTCATAAIVLSTSFDVEKEMVLITVGDEGCGIASEDLGKITQPFYTTKLDNGGSGLGLSVSQSLISRHGGDLHVISRQGKGTTVTVSLPIC